jgi:hypothetical protein
VRWYRCRPHDGDPYESRRFIVYSDAASQDARQTVAEIGEALLTELTAEFGIPGDEVFRFPPGQDKIHIYAYIRTETRRPILLEARPPAS